MKTTFTKILALALTVAYATALTGCGKNAPESGDAVLQLDRPDQMRLIARKQGWQIENVEAQHRAWDAFDSGQQPAEADWQRLVRAADTEKNGFDLELAMMFSRHMTDKYRAPVLRWSERNMEQTADPYAAVVGYDCYVRSGGSGRDLWASRLKARGHFYVEKIAEADKRAVARK
jgi:hypothetical protein